MAILLLFIGYTAGALTGVYVGISMAKEFQKRDPLKKRKIQKHKNF